METEGIIGALESTHAIAGAVQEAPELDPETKLLVNLSGRGDKDIFTIADALGDEGWKQFLRKRGTGEAGS